MKNSHPPQSGERSGDIRSIYRDRGFQPASSKRIRRLFPQASRGTDWLHGSTNCSSRQAGRPKVQAQSSMSTGAKGEFLGRGRSRAQPTPIVQLSPEKDTGGVFRTDCSLSLFIKSSFSVHGFAGACFFAQGDLSHSEIPLPNPHTWSVLRSASGFYPPFFWGKGGGLGSFIRSTLPFLLRSIIILLASRREYDNFAGSMVPVCYSSPVWL